MPNPLNRSSSTQIWDISQPMHPGMPVWPGDTPFAASRTWHLGEDCPVNVAKFSLSTHAGTHADAPLHYAASGRAIDAVSLASYIGTCRVVGLENSTGPISPQMIEPFLADCPPRLLIRTYAKAPVDGWDNHFRPVSAEVIERMANAGVILIGTDTPSLDSQDSKTMDAHHTVFRRSMAILEGLVLDDIVPGDYELIALPLKLSGLDASPVRAVLRSLQ